MMAASLGSLLGEAQAGDDCAFAALANRLWPALAGITRPRLLWDPDGVADVVQETLLFVWQYLQSFESEEHLRRMAFVVARRRALDRVRQRQRDECKRRGAFHILVGERVYEPVATNTDEPFPGLDLECLSASDRRMLGRHYCQGLSTREIGDLEGRSRGAVKQSLHRIRHRLRRHLSEVAA